MKKLSFLLLSILVILSACGPTLPLQYQGHSDFTVNAGSDNPSVQTTLSLYNPNRIGATLTGLELEVQVGTTTIGHIQLDEQVHVRRKQIFALPFTLSTTYPKLTEAATSNLAQVISGRPVSYALAGEVTLRKFFLIKRTFDVAYTDSLVMSDLKF